MKQSCTILVLGHLPSADNRSGLRSRDLDVDAVIAAKWRTSVEGAHSLFRCFGLLIDATYCPMTRRHLDSARLLAELLGLDDPIPDIRLNNIDYGVYKGRPLGETPSLADTPNVAYQGGESWNQVVARWQEFCAQTLSQHDKGVVLLAGQSGAAPRMLMHICDRVPLQDALACDLPDVPFFSGDREAPARTVVWRYSWD